MNNLYLKYLFRNRIVFINTCIVCDNSGITEAVTLLSVISRLIISDCYEFFIVFSVISWKKKKLIAILKSR